MDQTASDPRQLEDFVRSILLEKNLPGVTEEVLPGLIAETTEQLRQVINMAVIDALPPQKQEELNGLLDNPATTPQSVSDFIMQSGVDISQVTTDTMVRFRALYLEGPEIAT